MDYWTGVRDWTPRIVRLLARYRLCPSHLYHLPLDYDDKTKSVVLGDTSEFERYAGEYLELGHHFNSMPVPYFFAKSSKPSMRPIRRSASSAPRHPRPSCAA